MKWILLLVTALQTSVLYGVSTSSNPGAVNIEVGTGALGEKLGFSKNAGLRLGGLWIGDENYLYSGGIKPHHWSGNSLFILDFSADMEKMICWNGAKFGTSFLQFNGSPTNADAGSVQGYNSLPGPSPLNRSELYELWYRQEFFNNKFVIRIGKIVPSYDFNNVIKPLPIQENSLDIPVTTGLIYTPIFVDPTLLGVLPGYYNSAYGITATATPIKSFYASCGFYDGSLAQGKQTGLRGPQFKSYYFGIVEIGFDWKIGKNEMPGNLGIGVWNQSGKLTAPPATHERGIQGIYLFGTQRVWRKAPGVDNSGIIGFYQAGYNNSKTLPMNRYLGGGFTFLGLIPGRLEDSFGFGAAWSRLNCRLFSRKQELIVQGYYQAHLWKSFFFLTALSYVPKPGAGKDLNSAWASTARIIALF